MTDTREVVAFVTDTLGCACPAEVFESITVQRGCAYDQPVPVEWEIGVGGRLLVWIAGGDVNADGLVGFESLVRKGQVARQSLGFNRLRLVITSVADFDKRAALTRVFRDLVAQDERVHLHFVQPDQVPRLDLLSPRQ